MPATTGDHQQLQPEAAGVDSASAGDDDADAPPPAGGGDDVKVNRSSAVVHVGNIFGNVDFDFLRTLSAVRFLLLLMMNHDRDHEHDD